MPLKVLFHTPQLDVRGTCTATYDYAHYNEVLLGNKSVIISKHNHSATDILAVKKFEERFTVLYYNNIDDIDVSDFDVVYNIKYGKKGNDNELFKGTRNVIHCVFDMTEPHGDVYAGVSQALATKFGSSLFVPHMIGLKPSISPTARKEFRKSLGIPDSAVVFGRHGGTDTFDLDFVKETIKTVVRMNEWIYYVFINTPAFDNHPRLIFCDKIITDTEKTNFISSCDACIHAQSLGETFGLSVGEFSVHNKPIITYGGYTWNRAHKDILGDRAMYYKDAPELYKIFTEFYPHDAPNCYDDYSPEKVMRKFKEVFLEK